MEENKNVELEQTQNSEEIIKEDSSLEQETAEEIDSDFVDINKEEMKKNYIIIAILYFAVIILSILLVLGIKNQKDTVKDKIYSDREANVKVEENNDVIVTPEEKSEETPNEETEKKNNTPNTNNNNKNELNDELNILDQI